MIRSLLSESSLFEFPLLRKRESVQNRVCSLFRVMKLGRYVTVDDATAVTMSRNVRIKMKKIITPHNESLGRLCAE